MFSILILNCQNYFFRSDLFLKYDRNNCCIIEKTVAPGDVILTMKT